ncbi:hypothetical protein [Psychroserpens algicola]|uniref:DUF4034 domain-containing protein n=1 Tax=Psychroserpens algicola TaxID=1719034 RepID=A0ABT0H611_9FLAO|nr:hypothetical protein [Psychroserpens algicola]MCK8479798.1 hypothetical protein [Psychroserpens algicola]
MKKLSFLIVICFISLAAFSQINDSKLLPSEALTLMINKVENNPGVKRIELTKPYLTRLITDSLSKEEQFCLGEVYFWNFMPKESFNSFSTLLDGNDLFARAAWHRTMIINIRAFKKVDEVEKQLSKFRKKFNRIPSDPDYLYSRVYDLADIYLKKQNHKKIVELIEQEIKGLKHDGPYKSLLLPAIFIDSFKEVGRYDYAIKLLKESKFELEKTYNYRLNNIPKGDTDYLVHSSRVKGMLTVVNKKLSYTQINDLFKVLISNLDNALNKFEQS